MVESGSRPRKVIGVYRDALRGRLCLFRLFFLEPRGVHQVAVGNFLVEFLALCRVDFLDEFGRNTSPDSVGFDDGVCQYQGAGSHDGSFSHYGVVEEGSSHANQGIVVYAGSVECHVVADGYVVADFYGRFFIQSVEYGAVLDVHPVADADGVHISPEYGIEPYATVFSHYYIADNGGVVGQITVFTDLRSKSSDRFYQCHKFVSFDRVA